MYDLIIVGAGPAGLVAAVYAARKKMDTLLISGDIGGQINTTAGIENYLGYQFIEGPMLVDKFREQMDKYPVEQLIGNKVAKVARTKDGFEVIDEKGNRFTGKTVLLALGKKPRHLKVPGEKEYMGKGVSYCAVCDGPIFSGQRVAIVGGGNSGLEAAIDMLKIAGHVSLVTDGELTGDKVLVDKLKEFGQLKIYKGYRVEKIEGDNFVKSVTIKPVRDGKTVKLDVTGIFVEIGLEPNSEPIKDLLPLNDAGEITISCDATTGVPGLYAAGDVTDVPAKQIIVAAGDGAKAALMAHHFLQYGED
jgi:alkyl hydroperoxide reductase subunit F